MGMQDFLARFGRGRTKAQGPESAPPADDAFARIRSRHDGPDFLTPTDLSVTPAPLRRVLIVGSCLAESWRGQLDCPNDFVVTNHLDILPEAPPRPIADYDLQLIQIPMRLVIPDDNLWHLPFPDAEAHARWFEEIVRRLRHYLEGACAWNIRHGILTFVANFLVPQQNAMGRLAPRYDFRNPVYFAEQLNRELARVVEGLANAHVLDVDQVAASFGKRFIQDDAVLQQNHGGILNDFGAEMDQARIEAILPLSRHYSLQGDAFAAAIWNQVKAMVRSIRQQDAVKLVIVDLDDTLWRGIVAEHGDTGDAIVEGWPLGLAEALAYLKKRGILLAIASKNDAAFIEGAWDKIMRGRLRLDDFACRMIDWSAKTDTIARILDFTRILPGNAVFIDDNPVEREAVRRAFPSMRVLGRHPYYLRRILLWSAETQPALFTDESARRTELLQAETARSALRQSLSRQEFLDSLAIEITVDDVENAGHADFPRAFELLNKTNQFNTTGRRWSREQCVDFLERGNRFRIFRVRDRFADHGLVGCLLVAGNRIEQFVMSCRVIGLDVETQILTGVEGWMRGRGVTEIAANLIATDHNFPCRELYARHGFRRSGEDWLKALG